MPLIEIDPSKQRATIKTWLYSYKSPRAAFNSVAAAAIRSPFIIE